MENKNIVFNCTLEQYNKKYRNRRYRLLKYTKKQVEDFDKQYGHYVFNNKTYTLEFNKYLLKDRKWALIGDTYYEIPRPVRYTWFRNLNAACQVGTCVLLAGAVGGGVYGITYAITHSNPIAIVDTSLSEYLKIKKIDNDKDGNTVIHLGVLKPVISKPEVLKGEHKLTEGTEYKYDGYAETGEFEIVVYKEAMEKYPGQIVIKAEEQEADSCKIDWNTRKIESTNTLRDLALDCVKLVIGTNQKYKETAEKLGELVTYNVEEGDSPTGIIKAYYGKNQNDELELYVLSDKRIAFDDNDRISGGYYGFFYYLNNLKSIILENIDTSNVEDFSDTFGACAQNLSEIDVSQFNTSKAKNMKNMFHSFFYFPPTIPLTIKGLENFDTSKVTNMDSMFYYCKCSSLDLSNFDTSNVTSMQKMFYGCSDLKTIKVSNKFVTTGITETGESLSTDMFKSCSQLIGGSGTTYADSNPADKTYARIDGGAINPGYFTEKK